MEIEYGAHVIDKNGNDLGIINHIVYDTWTGKLRKFVVRREAPHDDLFLSLDNIAEITEGRVQLNLSSEELSAN